MAYPPEEAAERFAFLEARFGRRGAIAILRRLAEQIRQINRPNEENIAEMASARPVAAIEPAVCVNLTASLPRRSDDAAPSSSVPDPKRAEELAAMDFAEYATMERSQMAEKSEVFTSFKFFRNYADRYVGKTNRPKVSKPETSILCGDLLEC
jgi:hypothetical protein